MIPTLAFISLMSGLVGFALIAAGSKAVGPRDWKPVALLFVVALFVVAALVVLIQSVGGVASVILEVFGFVFVAVAAIVGRSIWAGSKPCDDDGAPVSP